MTDDPGSSPPKTGSDFVRFLVAGGLNTAVTYLLYFVLLWFLPYVVSYTISYAAGILIAYELNRSFVFRARHSAAAMVATPLVYLLNYLIGVGLVTLAVGRVGIDARVAPLLAIVCTTPIAFVLTRWVFRRNNTNAAP